MDRFPMFVLVIVAALLGLSAMLYSFNKCGWATFLHGDGAIYAALSGACDE